MPCGRVKKKQVLLLYRDNNRSPGAHALPGLVVVREEVAGCALAIIEARAVEAADDARAAAGQEAPAHIREAVEERHLHAGRHHRVGFLHVDVVGYGLRVGGWGAAGGNVCGRLKAKQG